MFEYHGNNLTVDADGVSVTVALVAPLDIEKPLADLDLTKSEVAAVSQFVISRDELPPYAGDMPDDEFERLDYHFFNGYTSSDWRDGVDYEGQGNKEVIARAVPFLELGVKGLMAFCSQESLDLKQWLEDAHVRSDELEKIAKECESQEAAELERIMPKRESKAAFKELEEFGVSLGIDLESDSWNTALLPKINDRDIRLGWIKHRSRDLEAGIVVHQESPSMYNGRLGGVRITERGYFGVVKKESISYPAEKDEAYAVGYVTPPEALEAAAKFVAEGEEESWDEGPTLPGLPLAPEKDQA